MIGVECKGKQSQRVRVILYLPVISRLQVVPYRLKRIARYDPLVGVHMPAVWIGCGGNFPSRRMAAFASTYFLEYTVNRNSRLWFAHCMAEIMGGLHGVVILFIFIVRII